jgi:hypothetical protein
VSLPIAPLALRIAVGSDPALATNLHPRTTSEAFLTCKHHVFCFHSNLLAGSRNDPTFVAQCNKTPSIVDWSSISHDLSESSVVSCILEATEAHQVPNFESHLIPWCAGIFYSIWNRKSRLFIRPAENCLVCWMIPKIEYSSIDRNEVVIVIFLMLVFDV